MEVVVTEHLDPAPARALAALLDVPPPADGALPLTWHWLYLLDRPATADVGPDGHAVRGVLPVPPGPGFRRMWAGGRVASVRPLLLGRPATRTSAVHEVVEKTGASGPLVFVTVRHTVRQDGEVAVVEDQQVVYRRPGPPLEPPPARAAVPPGPGERAWEVTVPLLFRYSALTYNGHRIHYDRDHARSEGYPGLVVHGPLQALLMAEVARAAGQPGDVLDYRLVAPLLDDQGLVAGSAGSDLHVRDAGGRVTARAVVSAGTAD